MTFPLVQVVQNSAGAKKGASAPDMRAAVISIASRSRSADAAVIGWYKPQSRANWHTRRSSFSSYVFCNEKMNFASLRRAVAREPYDASNHRTTYSVSGERCLPARASRASSRILSRYTRATIARSLNGRIVWNASRRHRPRSFSGRKVTCPSRRADPSPRGSTSSTHPQYKSHDGGTVMCATTRS